MYISVLLPIQIGKTMKGQNQKKICSGMGELYCGTTGYCYHVRLLIHL